MKNKILIKTDSLKSFLSLFNTDDIVNNIELGDTSYQSEGFIDESILKGKNKIQEILLFPYDFNGLVSFKGNIQDFKIKYLDSEFLNDVSNLSKRIEQYEVIGTDYKIRELKNKIEALKLHKDSFFDYYIEKLYY